MKSLFDKLKNGELPFRAEVTTKNGEISSMVVSDAKVIIDGVETTLLDDEITISSNSADGDKTNHSSASISIPVKNSEAPEIKTEGNASVTNTTSNYHIEIKDNPKKLKIKSESGLFAIVRIKEQRDTNSLYYDIYFGKKGKEESVDDSGQKNRPHIALYPDGNGKFIRLSGYKCNLKSNLNYCPSNKTIYPSSIEIHSIQHSETIAMNFQFNENSNT